METNSFNLNRLPTFTSAWSRQKQKAYAFLSHGDWLILCVRLQIASVYGIREQIYDDDDAVDMYVS